MELALHPHSTAKQIAAATGISRERVYQLAREGKVDLATGHTFLARESGQLLAVPTPFGGRGRLSSHFIGGAGELTVCADLLRRGIPVYRACTFVSAADLIIDLGGKLLRIEVRSATRNGKGTLRYPHPSQPERYDVLALVDRAYTVTYRPDILIDL
jgi:hypothetical protein